MNDPDFYKFFNNSTLRYDTVKYDLSTLVLELVREIYPQVKSLETIHQSVDPKNIVDITNHVQYRFASHKFMRLFDDFAKEYVAGLLDNKKYLIKRQPTLNCVIPEQEKHARRLPFHQGVFYNNGRGMGTIWMPLTRATGTNSMYIAGLQDSRTLTQKVIKEKMDVETFEKHCIKICSPVEKSPGEAHLFTQEHIHGNVNNTTGVTRCAIDWHVLVEGEEYGGREPGGFFRLPGDFEQAAQDDNTNLTFVSYVSNNSRYDKEIPLHLQRKVIDDYCDSKKIKHVGVQFENEHLHWLPILEEYINQRPDGIVLFSIHSLPNDRQRANDLLNSALEKQVQLHFANETCSLKNTQDLAKIKTYLEFAVKKKGPNTWEV